MRALTLVCSFAMSWIALPLGRAWAQPLELTWSAPDGCPDRERILQAVAERLGERGGTPVEASGQIEAVDGAYVLRLRAQGGERRLEAVSCNELAQSAAVILALLIDPQAPQPEPEPEPTPPPSAAGDEPGLPIWGLLRAELLGDVGFLPGPALGPGLALGIGIANSLLELSGTYLPAHDLNQPASVDVGDVQAFAARLGVCQVLLPKLGFGACAALEYTRLIASGGDNLPRPENHGATVWSAQLGARLSLALNPWLRVLFELGLGLPFIQTAFTLDGAETYATSRAVGRLRTGLELRF